MTTIRRSSWHWRLLEKWNEAPPQHVNQINMCGYIANVGFHLFVSLVVVAAGVGIAYYEVRAVGFFAAWAVTGLHPVIFPGANITDILTLAAVLTDIVFMTAVGLSAVVVLAVGIVFVTGFLCFAVFKLIFDPTEVLKYTKAVHSKFCIIANVKD